MNNNKEQLNEKIILTDKAAKRVNAIIEGEKKDNCFLRISVSGGGCSGMSYVCEGEEPEKKSDDDTVIPYDTFDIVIDRKAIIYLKGMELDYDGGLGGTGFVFTNPLATSTCGCGESFSVT